MDNPLSTRLGDAVSWRVPFAPKALIYEEGDRSTCLYRLETGCVRLQLNHTDGTRQILKFVMPGQFFGLCQDVRYSSAEAVTKVEVTHFSLSSLQQLQEQNHDIASCLVNEAMRQFHQLAHHLESISKLPAIERVRRFLEVELGHSRTDPLPPRGVPMTCRDIADYLAITPETLSRALHELKSQRPRLTLVTSAWIEPKARQGLSRAQQSRRDQPA